MLCHIIKVHSFFGTKKDNSILVALCCDVQQVNQGNLFVRNIGAFAKMCWFFGIALQFCSANCHFLLIIKYKADL